MSADRIIAWYLIETPLAVERQNGRATYFEQVRKGQTEASYGKQLLEQTLLAANAN